MELLYRPKKKETRNWSPTDGLDPTLSNRVVGQVTQPKAHRVKSTTGSLTPSVEVGHAVTTAPAPRGSVPRWWLRTCINNKMTSHLRHDLFNTHNHFCYILYYTWSFNSRVIFINYIHFIVSLAHLMCPLIFTYVVLYLNRVN